MRGAGEAGTARAYYGIKVKGVLRNKRRGGKENKDHFSSLPRDSYFPPCLPPRSPPPASDFLHLLCCLHLPCHHPAAVWHKLIPLQNRAEHVVSARDNPAGCHSQAHNELWGDWPRGILGYGDGLPSHLPTFGRMASRSDGLRLGQGGSGWILGHTSQKEW